MKQCSTLVKVQFTESETGAHFQYKKLCIRIAFQVDERFKTQDLRKLKNIRKISKSVGSRAKCPLSFPVKTLWSQLPKVTEKQISKFFDPFRFYQIFLLCLIKFVQDFVCTTPFQSLFIVRVTHQQACNLFYEQDTFFVYIEQPYQTV